MKSKPFDLSIIVRAALCIVAATIVLSGCGGGSTSSTASVRLVNATLTHPSLDLWVNGAPAESAAALDSISANASAASGAATLQVDDAGSATSLVTVPATLVDGGHYSLVVYEAGGAVKTVAVPEDWPVPAVGAATLRVNELAADAGKLDVYISGSPVVQASNLSTMSPVGAVTAGGAATVLSASYSPGSYYVTATASGNPVDVRMMDMPIVLASQQVANVLLTPAVGSQLLNGSLLIQQGAYSSAFRNTNTRIRLASAVSANATVAASAVALSATITIDPGSVAPQFDSYALVPAGTTLNITVNGAPVVAPSTALLQGGDMTLLVYGAPGSSTATLLTDDNRLPSDPATVRMRMINGISGNSASLLTLTANSATVASQVAPEVASTYATVASSPNPMNLTLYSTQKAGIYYSNSSYVLNANSVYTILAAGDFSAPFLLIR